MKKTLFALLTAVLTLTAQAAPDLLLRGEAVPGSAAAAGKADEKVTLTAEYAAAGTCAFWVRPEGWDQTDKAWHFFLVGGKHSKTTPYVIIYRLPAGKVRMVWCKDDAKHELTDIFANVAFRGGEWTHFALTWRDDAEGCVIKLYVNGKMISARRLKFKMEQDFPLEWLLGDTPRWTPYSKFKTTLGRIEFHKRALSADEVAALAAQKFVDGKMSFVSRKFIPGSVNRVSGECLGPAVKLEAVFVDEAGKEVPQALPFV